MHEQICVTILVRNDQTFSSDISKLIQKIVYVPNNTNSDEIDADKERKKANFHHQGTSTFP